LSRWLELPLPRLFRWALLDASPYNPAAVRGDAAPARARLGSSTPHG
jgi:hypothetical protein